MATYFTLTERRNACPACHATNVLIGSDIIDGMEVRCSRCVLLSAAGQKLTASKAK